MYTRMLIIVISLLLVSLSQLVVAQITTDCDTAYRCFRSPANCVNTTCSYIYKWRNNGATLTDFALYVNVGTVTNKWIAIGFSTDTSMGSDDVVVCKSTNAVEHYRNNGQTPSLLNSANPTIGLTNGVVTTSGTWLICSFTRQLSLSTQTNYFDLNNNYYVLAAYGNLGSNAALQYHSNRVASSSTFSFKFAQVTTTTVAATTTTTTTTRPTTTTTAAVTTTTTATRPTTTTTAAVITTTTTRPTTTTTAVVTTTTTRSTTTITTTTPSGTVTTSDCGVAYACFLEPANCIDTACTFVYKWKSNGNTMIDFRLYANVGTVTNKWIAIGFSSDAVMGGADDVIACKSTNVIERYSTNGRTLNSVNDSTTAISSRVISTSGTWLICSFTRLITMSGLSNFYDLSTSYYLLAAYGDFNAGTGVLSYHTARQPSSSAFSFKFPDTTGPTATTTTGTATTTLASGSIETSDCEKTKGCFLHPSKCQGSACIFIYKYSSDGNNTVFDLYGKVGSTSNPWLAIGFSNDQKMGEDGVCMCSYQGFVEQRYNSAQSAPNPIDPNNPSVGMSNVNVTIANGWLRCRFTRQKFLPSTNNYFDLNKEFYLLAAYGPSTSVTRKRAITATLLYHLERVPSSAKVNFNSFSTVSALDTLPYIKSHACLMVFAWMLFASTGIIFARYYKFILPNVKLCKLQFWFIMHRPIMTMVPLMSIAGFLVILAENQWKWVPVESKVMFAHSIFGIVAVCFAIIQPFIAIARCDKGKPNRYIFDFVHRTIGLSALLFSIVALFLGTMTSDLELGNNGWGIILGWTIWLVLFALTLEFIQMRYEGKPIDKPADKPKEENDSSTNYINRIEQFDSIDEPDANKKKTKAKTKTKKSERNSGEGIKEFLLVAHVLITIAFSVALVVLIGISE